MLDFISTQKIYVLPHFDTTISNFQLRYYAFLFPKYPSFESNALCVRWEGHCQQCQVDARNNVQGTTSKLPHVHCKSGQASHQLKGPLPADIDELHKTAKLASLGFLASLALAMHSDRVIGFSNPSRLRPIPRAVVGELLRVRGRC